MSGLGRGLRWLVMLGVVGMPAVGQTVSEQYLLAAANQERAQRNLPMLKVDPMLRAAALRHAGEMARRGTISHQFAGEPDLVARASAAGARFSVVSENVAQASNAALIHDLWMHSEGHRANLLDGRVDAVGIAVVARGGELYAVEDFEKGVANLSLQEQEAAVGYLLEQRGVVLTSDEQGQRDARATCRMETGYAGKRQPWFVMRYTAGDLGALPKELTAKLAAGKLHEAAVGACSVGEPSKFTSYSIAILLYP